VKPNIPVTLVEAERILRAMGRRHHGERIRKRKAGHRTDAAGAYSIETIRGHIPVTAGQTVDSERFSLTDIARRYEQLAQTDLQRSVIKAVLAGECDWGVLSNASTVGSKLS